MVLTRGVLSTIVRGFKDDTHRGSACVFTAFGSKTQKVSRFHASPASSWEAPAPPSIKPLASLNCVESS